MQGHDAHQIGLGSGHVLHHQADMLEEGRQGLELLHRLDQLLQVLQTTGASGVRSACHIAV